MKKNMRKSIFSIDGSSNEDTWIEGYFNPDDGRWNGWEKVILPIETLTKFLDDIKYDWTFFKYGDDGQLAIAIDWEEPQLENEIFDVIEFETVDGEVMKGCYMDGWCYVEVGENYNG